MSWCALLALSRASAHVNTVLLCVHVHVHVQIIDSVTALFRADYTGRGELSERQQKLNQHMNHLKKIAEDLNLAVVLINQGGDVVCVAVVCERRAVIERTRCAPLVLCSDCGPWRMHYGNMHLPLAFLAVVHGSVCQHVVREGVCVSCCECSLREHRCPSRLVATSWHTRAPLASASARAVTTSASGEQRCMHRSAQPAFS